MVWPWCGNCKVRIATPGSSWDCAWDWRDNAATWRVISIVKCAFAWLADTSGHSRAPLCTLFVTVPETARDKKKSSQARYCCLSGSSAQLLAQMEEAQWLWHCAAKPKGTVTKSRLWRPLLSEGGMQNWPSTMHWVHVIKPKAVKINAESATVVCLIIMSWFWPRNTPEFNFNSHIIPNVRQANQ